MSAFVWKVKAKRAGRAVTACVVASTAGGRKRITAINLPFAKHGFSLVLLPVMFFSFTNGTRQVTMLQILPLETLPRGAVTTVASRFIGWSKLITTPLAPCIG